MSTTFNPFSGDQGSRGSISRKALVVAGVIVLALLTIGVVLALGQTKDKAAVQENSDAKPVPAKDVVKVYPQGEVVDGVVRYHVTVNNRKITDGPSEITIKKGANILIEFVTDTDVENETKLEGYDASTSIGKGSVGQMSFTADKAGTFNIVSVKTGNTDAPGSSEPVVMGSVKVTE